MLMILKQKIAIIMPWTISVYHAWNRFLVRYRQQKILKKLLRIYQQNTRKIRVAFFVTENEKWCCQNLFDKLKKNPHFEPLLFLSAFTLEDLSLKQEKFYKNQKFFKKACGKIIEVYNPQTDKFLSLKPYKPDIIFYQQPWGIYKKQNIIATSKFALSCYIPYSFENDVNMIKRNLYCFHNLLFKEYISHPLIKQKYLSKGCYKIPMKVVGYPKLETYLQTTEQYQKKYVIYAPHHSVEPNSLRLSTFAWNGHFILEYAKKHSEFNWLFKPHPRCKESFIKEGLFKNRKELDAYYNEWASIGEVCETGNYIDLFKQTKCLITDCGSFLVEFFPTKQPVIHLKRLDSNLDAIIDEIVASTYYSVYDLPSLERVLYTVLEQGQDTMQQIRINKLNELNLLQAASENVIKDLEESFSNN